MTALAERMDQDFAVSSPQCLLCVHYRGRSTCAAFSVRIPDAIYANRHDHRQVYPGDNGVRFERITAETS